MQSYPLILSASVPATAFPADADLFVYESGSVSARTNFAIKSQAMDEAAWVKNSSTVTANAGIAPDGTMTADKMIDGAAVTSHSLLQNIAGHEAGAVTISVYAKPLERTKMSISTYNVSVNEAASFDLATGVVSAVTPGASASMVLVAGGYYRCQLTRQTTAGAVSVYLSSGTTTAGDGVAGLLLWGAQLEQGNAASAYIGTDAAPVSAAVGSAAIKVKPENGQEIVLKPGQRFRIVGKSQRWYVSPADGVSAIAGTVIIGSGEFEDSNTANTFKLDASFANTVTVTNPTTQRIPVTLDPAQLLKIDPSTALGTSAPLMAYTNSVAVVCVAGGASQLVSAAQNVNGVIIEQIIGLGITNTSLLAKSTIPGNIGDGDVLAMSLPYLYTTRQKVPAGKTVWVWNNTAGASTAYVLFTLL